MNIIEANLESIKENFHKWVDRKRKDGELGNALYNVWNAFCEDRMHEADMLFDLNEPKDFAQFYLECGFKDKVIKENDINLLKSRYGWVSEDKNTFVYNDEDLLHIINPYFEEICECILAYPDSYDGDLYRVVAWTIYKNEFKMVDLD